MESTPPKCDSHPLGGCDWRAEKSGCECDSVRLSRTGCDWASARNMLGCDWVRLSAAGFAPGRDLVRLDASGLFCRCAQARVRIQGATGCDSCHVHTAPGAT